MILEFLKLEMLKFSRSNAFARSMAVAVFLALIGLLLLSYVFLLGISLPFLISEFFEGQEPIAVLNGFVVYFFLFEIVFRYFLQKLPVLELESLLHHPLKKSFLVNFLLLKSFVSPLSVIAVLLFLPFAIMELVPALGRMAALGWVGTIVFASWALHYTVLWFKQRFDDSIWSILVLMGVIAFSAASNYLGWIDLGAVTRPWFDAALLSPLPVVLMGFVLLASYYNAYRFYKSNAYVEDLSSGEEVRFGNQSIGLFKRFGLAGEFANLEWKLILRHKKSRSYLTLAGFFLLYGLIFYTNPVYVGDGDGIPYFFIFVGAFITGVFVFQYGQLFLSWNSSSFDFYLQQRNGVEALVKGKYLLFVAVSVLSLLLSVPYLYFGWHILFIHISAFLFNIGVTMHMVVWLSLWKPKPMDLNKGAMFNYEGVGIAQFLMIIPMLLAPYVVYVPASLLFGDYLGLLALAIVGVIGILAFPQLAQVPVKKILENKYEISSAFRQEL